MKTLLSVTALLTLLAVLTGCNTRPAGKQSEVDRIPVIIDTDANNELDDQHALAYLLLNDKTFHTIGVTVNTTMHGGEIAEHVKEANRIVQLCGLKGVIPVFSGANGAFPEIREHTGESVFDGHEAVDFIIAEALKKREQKLVLLPVGKLTNVALALKKEPAIAENIRVVWLGSNYPLPGEYNLDNDTAALSFVLRSGVPFEIATVRYGDYSGTAEVKVTQAEIFEKMPGLGPEIEEPVTGRHGDTFTNFGDYSVSLFSHTEFFDEEKSRSLFDMAAVAVVKDPSWAIATEIATPLYLSGQWVEQPDNPQKIVIWGDFDKEKILADFYASFD
ncbi:MAG: nucleoside hydrolase [Bacteroidota bacterium]